MVKVGSSFTNIKNHEKPKMYNTNIVIGSKNGSSKNEEKCDVLAVYMPDEDIQSQLLSKLPKECIDYRSYLPVYQPTTLPLRQELKKNSQRKILLGLLFAAIIVLFMSLGGTIGKLEPYNTNIVIGSHKEDIQKKKAQCDVLPVYIPDVIVQKQLWSKQLKGCVDYRDWFPVYNSTTMPLPKDLKKNNKRKIVFCVLGVAIFLMFIGLGCTIAYGVYKGTL